MSEAGRRALQSKRPGRPAVLPVPGAAAAGTRPELAPPDLRPLTPAVLAMAGKYGYDAEHARQVADLALQIFEGLPEVHGLGREWAALLQHAALLHDVGYFIHARRHHRHSQYLTLHDALLSDYPPPWREALALLARNHRKRPRRAPMAWGPERGRALLGLAGILRIADGCDYGHDGAARIVGLQIRRGGLDFALRGLPLEGLAPILRRKARLFARTYALPVSFSVEA